MKLYGLRIEVVQEELLEDIIMAMNCASADRCAVCILDNLDKIVADYRLLENRILRLEEVSKMAKTICENAVSIRMRYYPDEKSISSIDDYEEFSRSDCFVLLWGYDCYYYNIYCKDTAALYTIEAILKSKNGFAVDPIDHQEDILTGM